jgi:AraC family transcriptional regulator, transcriptional activator of the genes for pyochelin and ferripyochelin receptors
MIDEDDPPAPHTLNITRWELPGLRISYLDGQFQQTGAITEWELQPDVTMIFLLKGSIRITAPSSGTDIQLTTQTHTTFWLGDPPLQLYTAELQLKTLVIQFDTVPFLQYAHEGTALWQRFAKAMENGQPANLYPQPLYINLGIQSCIQAILNYPLDVTHQRLYLHAKALELMALQADCLHEVQNSTPVFVKTDYDRERLLFAKDYLLQNMALPPSLTDLARIAGINEFKLKRGFKEMFGHTVFGYLAEARLELAKAALQEGRKTATEIAFELGYSSLQHFSHAFKKKFGVSPHGLIKG